MSALGFSNEIIGVFNSLPALALLGIGLPFAAMADRTGYRVFLVVAGALAAIGSLGLALAGQPLTAVLAAGTFALAVTILQVLSGPLLAEVSSTSERTMLFSVNQSIGWVAVLAGDLLGGLIPEAAGRASHASVSSAASIRTAFIAMTALVLLGLPFLGRLSRVAGARPAKALPIRDMLRVDTRRFARLLIPEVFLGIGAGMYLTFVQLYFSQRFHLTPGPIGVILAVGAALTAIGSLGAPAVGRRLGMSRAVGLSQLVGFPLIAALAFLTTLPLVVIIFYVRQIALNIQSPLATVFGMEYVPPEQRARLSTALTLGWGIGGGGIGPLASGFLQALGGFQLAFSIASVFYLLAGLSFLMLFGRVRLPSEDRPSVSAL